MGWATITIAKDAEERATVAANMNALGQAMAMRVNMPFTWQITNKVQPGWMYLEPTYRHRIQWESTITIAKDAEERATVAANMNALGQAMAVWDTDLLVMGF
jgi:hypothetical protein